MRPDANMTVGEFAAILSRAMGYTETVENPYADLKGTEGTPPTSSSSPPPGFSRATAPTATPRSP